jgi:TetR/AcrR family transcriptional regulator, transcriptional repressor of aconitase
MLPGPSLVKSECSFYIRPMPRVSQAHLDARRRQILDAARRCFVRNGFHATSMQDVLGEANLSAGAVYRYFHGKDEIIAAIAAEAVAEVAGALDSTFDADDPPPLDEVLGAAFLAIRRVDAEQGMAKLALQVWSEAVRSPTLAGILRDEIARVRDSLARLVGSYQDRGLMAADAPPEQVARVLIGLLPGFVVQHALLGDVDPDAFRTGLRTLLTTRLGAPLPSATTA